MATRSRRRAPITRPAGSAARRRPQARGSVPDWWTFTEQHAAAWEAVLQRTWAESRREHTKVPSEAALRNTERRFVHDLERLAGRYWELEGWHESVMSLHADAGFRLGYALGLRAARPGQQARADLVPLNVRGRS